MIVELTSVSPKVTLFLTGYRDLHREATETLAVDYAITCQSEKTQQAFFTPRNVLGGGGSAEISTVPALGELTNWQRTVNPIILEKNHRVL